MITIPRIPTRTTSLIVGTIPAIAVGVREKMIWLNKLHLSLFTSVYNIVRMNELIEIVRFQPLVNT